MRFLIIKLQLMLLVCCWMNVHSTKPGILILYLQKKGWTEDYNGFLIDTSGTYRSFSFSGDDNVGFMIDTDTLPLGMDARILEVSTPAGRQLGAGFADEIRSIIDTIGETEVTFYAGPEDMGTYRISTFLFDSVNERTREIICYQAGTTPACNSSPAAREIASIAWSMFDLGFAQDSWEHPPDSCRGVARVVSPARPAGKLPKAKPSCLFYDLRGKKVKRHTAQVIIGVNGKRPLLLKQTAFRIGEEK
jgi:hypothetical protein